MCNIIDYDDGDFIIKMSEETGMDSEGNLMMRMGDGLAMDMESGDLHLTSAWDDDERC